MTAHPGRLRSGINLFRLGDLRRRYSTPVNADPLCGEAMRIAIPIAAILVALSVTGCAGSSWPPHAGQLHDHFAQHHPRLEELADFMREQRLWTISRSAVRPPAVGFRTPGDQSKNDLTPDQAAYVASLLSSTQVASVTRVDSIVYLATGEGRVDSSYYTYGYIDVEPGSDPPEVCSSSQRGAAHGECRVPLQGSWSARYFWKPARS